MSFVLYSKHVLICNFVNLSGVGVGGSLNPFSKSAHSMMLANKSISKAGNRREGGGHILVLFVITFYDMIW